MNRFWCFLGLLLFIIMIPLSARGSKEPENTEKRIVQVTGVIRLIGNAPFSEFVVRNDEGQWYIAKEDETQVRSLQYQTLTIEGEETVKEMTFGNGMSAGQRRELRNIRIISVQNASPPS